MFRFPSTPMEVCGDERIRAVRAPVGHVIACDRLPRSAPSGAAVRRGNRDRSARARPGDRQGWDVCGGLDQTGGLQEASAPTALALPRRSAPCRPTRSWAHCPRRPAGRRHSTASHAPGAAADPPSGRGSLRGGRPLTSAVRACSRRRLREGELRYGTGLSAALQGAFRPTPNSRKWTRHLWWPSAQHDLAHGLDQAAVVVGADQAEAVQATLARGAQELATSVMPVATATACETIWPTLEGALAVRRRSAGQDARLLGSPDPHAAFEAVAALNSPPPLHAFNFDSVPVASTFTGRRGAWRLAGGRLQLAPARVGECVFPQSPMRASTTALATRLARSAVQ